VEWCSKREKGKFSGLSLQNVICRTANESQKDRKARKEKEEKPFSVTL
jgi:hypothetical protein